MLSEGSTIYNKRQNFANSLRKEHRESIIRSRREALIDELNFHEHPLISSTLHRFWNYSHREISQLLDGIYQELETSISEELNEEENNDLITDLLYLVNEQAFRMPSHFRFKKDESLYTANLIAIIWDQISTQELAYWIEFMGEEEKQLIFVSIDTEEESHKQWIQNQELFAFLLENCYHMPDACFALKHILENSLEITFARVLEIVNKIEDIIWYQKKIKILNKTVILSILIYLVLKFQKIMERPSEKEHLEDLLNKSIERSEVEFVCLQNLEALNLVYEKNVQTILKSEKILLKIGEQCQEVIQVMSENQSNQIHLLLDYFLKLVLHFWRVENLHNPSYCLPPDLFLIIQKWKFQFGEQISTQTFQKVSALPRAL